ncbi:hypothetical protein TSUD_277480 [Trifolium subterraneum]|uniref:Uncharacterized protein n=1 Tax=Trifolium subterraneum TaxID=3900 RepID=A0A2Z6NIV6_TRISU|nr:hypothetical protein TSUD_277480 [Trifolium subterraneum]
MAFSSSFCHSPLLALKVDHFRSNGGAEIELCNKLNVRSRVNLIRDRSFISGSRLDLKQKAMRLTHKKATPVYASLLSGSQLASSAFTIGTTAVLPFYTLMIFAPNSELLTSIGKMFSSEMTLASAWIHLLVMDLFAARQVFQDGQENQIETRHSVSFCLFFCPIGILSHIITKALTKPTKENKHDL